MGTKFKTILKENIKRWLKNNPQMFTDIFPYSGFQEGRNVAPRRENTKQGGTAVLDKVKYKLYRIGCCLSFEKLCAFHKFHPINVTIL